jgi:hypothetical protein
MKTLTRQVFIEKSPYKLVGYKHAGGFRSYGVCVVVNADKDKESEHPLGLIDDICEYYYIVKGKRITIGALIRKDACKILKNHV